MSAKHPAPWTIEDYDNGKRGEARAKWANILDACGVYVVEGLDRTTAREVVKAVNEAEGIRKECDRLRSIVTRMVNYISVGVYGSALLKEADAVLGKGGAE